MAVQNTIISFIGAFLGVALLSTVGIVLINFVFSTNLDPFLFLQIVFDMVVVIWSDLTFPFIQWIWDISIGRVLDSIFGN